MTLRLLYLTLLFKITCSLLQMSTEFCNNQLAVPFAFLGDFDDLLVDLFLDELFLDFEYVSSGGSGRLSSQPSLVN